MNEHLNEHLRLLGFKVRDAVTGFEGVVTSIGFDLFGCVQAIVTPQYKKKESSENSSRWFDVKRLAAISKSPVMPVPVFDFADVPGGAAKPDYPRRPL